MIEFRNVSKVYNNGTEALHNINLKVEKGEFVFIVGSSGAGKSTFLKLITCEERPNEGQVLIDGQDISHIRKGKIPYVRRKMGLVFQDFRLLKDRNIYENIAFALRVTETPTRVIKKKVPAALSLVGLAQKYKSFPKELSGGEQQRVAIARAIVNEPAILLADEPTTALDVTIQAQVLEMMTELKNKLNTSMILITHDLGVVAQVCDKVAIMYAGEIVEYGNLEDIYEQGEHPYTIGLFGSIPDLDKDTERLSPIAGLMPDPTNLPAGCSFSPRCPHCTDRCRNQDPPIRETVQGHMVKCHLIHTNKNRQDTVRPEPDGSARQDDRGGK